MIIFLLFFVKLPELWLIEVGVPALGKLFCVTSLRLWDLFLRRIVIVDLFGLLFCCDESFDFIEDVFINIHSGLFLFPSILCRCRISRNGAILRFLKKLFSLHLVQDWRYTCAGFSEPTQGLYLQILLLWIFSSNSRGLMDNSTSSCLLLICSWFRFFRVKDGVNSKESSIPLALNWGCARYWGQSVCHGLVCLSVVRVLFGPRLFLSRQLGP